MRALLAVGLLVLAAGCLDKGSTQYLLVASDGNLTLPTSQDYWMIHVVGEESRDYGPLDARVMCSVVFDHEVDVETRTLRRANQTVPAQDVGIAIVADHWQAESDCPLAYATHFNRRSVTLSMGAYGPLTVEVREDGTLVVDGTLVPLGKAYEARYEEGDDSGTFRVENLGAWPRARIMSA